MAEQIGLQGVFDLDQFDRGISDYIKGIKNAEDTTTRTEGTFGSAFDSMGKKVLSVAGMMSGAFVLAAGAASAAVGAFVVGGIRQAGDLESQMGAIASIMGETKDAVAPLKELILDLGLDPTLKVSATEAADAIEKLASNGLTMTQIMDGAAKSTVLLANSTGADFDTAASIATDAMALFNIKAGEMMTAVNGITGVTVASKFGINDYKLALSQAGGVAAATGVSFEDFNTTITGISNYFASGSDAGTSFKTMLLRLVPSTDAASEMMSKLGLVTFQSETAMKMLEANGIEPMTSSAGELRHQIYNLWASQNAVAAASDDSMKKFQEWKLETGLVTNAFYDANGSMRDMSEISVLLNGALAELSEEEKSKALNTIFGTDAMRAAVGIAEQGEVAYTDQATAAKALGVSFESLNGVIDGGITRFEALQVQIGKTDAAESAKLRMDNFKGSMEILQGVIDTVALKIGFAFLPVLKEMADSVSNFLSNNSDGFILFFENVAAAIEALFSGAPGDFPWEDIFPPWLAELMYNTIELVEGVGIAISDFRNGAMGVDYPWEDIFPEGLANAIYFVIENIDALTGALGGVAALLASAGIAAAITGIAAAIAGLLSPIGLAIMAAAAIGAAWNSNFLGIKDATLAVIQPIQDFISAVKETGLFSGQAMEALKDLAGAFGTMILEVAGNLGEWTATLGKWASEVGTVLLGVDYKAIGSSILNLVKDGWTSAVGSVMPALTSFGTELGLKLRTIDWKSVGTAILNFIKDGWEAAKAGATTAISAIATSWKNQFGDTVQNWSQTGKDVLDKIRLGMESAKATALAAVTTIASSIKDRYSTPEGFQWSTLGQDIVNLLRDGFLAAARSAAGIVAGALTIANSIKDQFTTLSWGEVGTAIITALRTGLETAAKSASGLIQAAKQVGLDLMASFTQINWEETGRAIASLIKDGFKAIAEGLNGLIPTARATGENVKTAFTSIDWISIGNAIINGIVTGVKAIAYGAAGLIYIVAQIVKGAASEFTGFDFNSVGQTIMTNIQTGVTNAKEAFLNVVRGIPTAIKKIFTDLAQDFKDIGSEIVNGIGAGITGAKDSLMEKAKSLANSLPGWVKEVLGISSPSKVFMVIGSQIIEGLIGGMENSMGSLRSTLQNISSTISGRGLLGIEFSSSSTIAERLRKDYLNQEQEFLTKIESRKKDAEAAIASILSELQRPDIDATRMGDLTTRLGLARDELALYSRIFTSTAQDIKNVQDVLYWGDQARRQGSFLEDQISLMQEAKKLGIDVSGVAVGDTSIQNLTLMANIERKIAELKQKQLEITASQLRTGGTSNPVLEGLQRSVSEIETFNSYLGSQLSMMKKASDLGMDLLTVWNSYITFDQNDVQRQLEFQKKLGELTKQDMLNQMTAMIAEQKRVRGLEAALKQLQPLMDMTNVSSVFGQRYKATVLDPLLRALEQAAGIDSERVRLMNEYTAAAQKLADIQRKEEQLNFLKEQMDVVQMIKDQDLVGGNSLFEGITFGVNASIDDLLTLTNRVLNSMIEEVKDTLGIHSPSAVFADIGMRMMEGLQNGIKNNIMQPLSALRQSTIAHGAVSTNTLNFAMGGVTINTPMDEVMFERRVMRVIERSF